MSGERYWVWLVVRLAVAVVLVGWAASYLFTGGGEREFQKTLDAMKQVHSFRVALVAKPGTQNDEALWEVDCSRDAVHYQWHYVNTGTTPPQDMSHDEIHVGTSQYDRQSDGSWSARKYAYQGTTAKSYCSHLAAGTDSNLLPQIATMIRRGILQKGDKKTVNGVRCREWLVTMKGGPSGLEHDTVCLGLEDHLPYEMTVDWEYSRSSFSDYNAPITFDVPDAVVQPTNTLTGSN